MEIKKVIEFVREQGISDRFAEWMEEYEDIGEPERFMEVLQEEGEEDLLEEFRDSEELYGSAYNKERPQIETDILESVRSDFHIKTAEAGSQLRRFVDPIPDPISLEQSIELSKQLTQETGVPCYVFSDCRETTAQGMVSGEYTQAEVKVTLALGDDESTKGKYELWRAYESRSYENPEVRFISEKKPSKWTKQPEKSLAFDRYLYLARHEDSQLILLSTTPLEVGQEYTVTGYCFEATKFDELRVNLGSLQSSFLSFNEEPALQVDDIDDEILEKCRDGGRQYVIDSFMYPWHHSVPDYKELWATNFFSANTGFPFNLMVIGESGLTKSSVLDKIKAITGEQPASGSGTLKGLIASFSSSNLSAGHLAESRDKALVNEFFEILENTSKDERYNYLGPMKELLEGKKAQVKSGNGTISTVMKADLCAVSNPPRKQGGAEFQSVIGMYDKFETAWLDRMLFYWIPSDDQEKLKSDWEDWADQKMEEANEDYTQLDYEDYLRPDELYQLLRYIRAADWENDASEETKSAKKELQKNHVPNKANMSRLRKFLVNIASGEAMIRMLGEGKKPADDVIRITAEDVRRAKDLLIRVFKTYTGDGLDSRGSKVAQLPEDEFKIYSKLNDYWVQNEEKYAKKIAVGEVVDEFSRMEDVEDKLVSLAEKGLVVMKDGEVMWMPELSSKLRQGLEIIKGGGEISKDKNWVFKSLSEKGLVSYDDQRGQYYLWDADGDAGTSTTDESGVSSLHDRILEVIDENDGGEGCEITVVEQEVDASEDDIEDVVDDLLSDGTLFQPRSGRLKRI